MRAGLVSTTGLMDTKASGSGTKMLKAKLELVAAAVKPKRSRRSWPDDEKQRIVSEALSPGASVADIARQHGVNANLLFNWVRSTRRVSDSQVSSEAASRREPAPPLSSSDFIPLGVFAHAPDGSPALLASAGPAEPVKLSSTRRPAAAIAQAETRSGLIEIELANGTKLRVDGFVNERALHRVLSVLKANS